MMNIVHKKEESRLVAYEGEQQIGMLTYAVQPDRWVANHTEVNPEYRGRNTGRQLVAALIAEAKAAKVKVEPTCRFIKKCFDENPEYQQIRA